MVTRYIVSTCLLFLIFTSPATAELIDKVVAVVNDDVITLSELDQEVRLFYDNSSQENSGIMLSDGLDEAREAALEKMINKKIILQQAKEKKINVSPEEVQAAYESTRERMGLSSSDFAATLKQSGMSEESYKDDLRVKLLQSRILGLSVQSKVVVTDKMVEDYYRSHYAEVSDGNGYYLLQMGFSWKLNKITQSKKECLETAQRVHERAKSGQDFRKLAKTFSDLPSASDGGDIGMFQLDDMAQAMRDAISPLKPGEISDIIETADGYQFFKLLSSKENNTNFEENFAAVKNEIRDKLFEEKLQLAYEKWVSELKEKAYIQKL